MTCQGRGREADEGLTESEGQAVACVSFAFTANIERLSLLRFWTILGYLVLRDRINPVLQNVTIDFSPVALRGLCEARSFGANVH